MNEIRIRQIFNISLILKGIHALVECAGGIVLAVVSTKAIALFVNNITQEELVEDPKDFVATHLLAIAHNFSINTKTFYAIYLFAHGIVNLALVVGLFKGKLWSYPASLIILMLLIAYQLYRYSYTHGLGLILLTIFDILIVVIIWHEYRLARRHMPTQ
ncbi:DUF2127 domain-containing protein [Asticcacaulis sp. EMRT-3]|uniref:DUF2127 domain-containing protein n=1 Tax=Asticcacaulis sp. EMRT-3 TaxID=3040349 RepID=UPI0024AF92CC|nr:DUF2127 domain-containing protein [Asticcacaulis sp. EMRT-3]MDI7774766.1 DUF2127 domain-containing protein [Asticcacaulis sp. EMRT-3]MDI7776529.1 DUF2127 domain-containing protein [Asticcacaulis sp. EMRT-3]